MPIVYAPDRIAFRPDKMNKVSLFDAPELYLDLYCLEPGQEQKVHTHSDAAKVYYVVEGEGRFRAGSAEETLGPGHAILAAAGEEHGVRNDGPDRLVLLVTMAPNPNRR